MSSSGNFRVVLREAGNSCGSTPPYRVIKLLPEPPGFPVLVPASTAFEKLRRAETAHSARALPPDSRDFED
jgi:hypothetical protein